MDEDEKVDGPTTEELIAEQPATEAELLPAASDAEEIEPYAGATEVEVQ